jgi:transposase
MRPQVSLGSVLLSRTTEQSFGFSIVRTRKVTVMHDICGVDISKDWLDAFAGPTGQFERFANTPDGIRALARFCTQAGVQLVVMEASGRYEQLAFLTLWGLGQPCTITNARAVRDFAKAMGHFEKTDRIDAEVIARYGAAKPLVPTAPPSEDQQKMAALVARLRQITSDTTIQKQRLSSAHDAGMRDSLLEVITLLKRQSKAIIASIAAMIETDPLWTALDRTFRSIKGVADKSVATLLAELPEIGTLSNKAIAKLAGLAPLADDSGKRHGKRSIRGGRANVRSLLYLVADIARKFDPSLASFRDRLLESGKPKMVVRVALAHKLLTRLNAKARDTRAEIANAI